MSIPAELQSDLESFLNSKIIANESVSGGDINEAFKIRTPDNNYFLKLNRSSDGNEILKSEQSGLIILGRSHTVSCPVDLQLFTKKSLTALLMPFIESGTGNRASFERLGHELANLHQCTNKSFGLSENNFIGRLFQSNRFHEKWPEFYANERILPQVKLAIDKGFLEISVAEDFDSLLLKAGSLFPTETPSLIHGDLWSGNYLIDKSGTPWLIDTSVYYGHREMDLAMSRLFGGFHPAFYESYHENYPLSPGFEERIDLYQLYYLLVHVNLFGRSYLTSVFNILKKYI